MARPCNEGQGNKSLPATFLSQAATISATLLHFVCSKAGVSEEKSPAVLLPLTKDPGALFGFRCTIIRCRCGM